MSHTCNVCKQRYPRGLPRCPHCAAREAERPAGVRSHSDPEVDLGNPTPGGVESPDPPSGASAYSWAQLLDTAAKADASLEHTPVRFARSPFAVMSGAALPAAPSDAVAFVQPLDRRRLWWHWLGGVAVGTALCVALWSVGVEPPQRWRQHVQRWFGSGASQPGEETRAPP